MFDNNFKVLQSYLTGEQQCSYLADKKSRSLVLFPPRLVNHELYGELIRRGFRRSGEFIYHPECNACQACTPIRIPSQIFRPNRSQQRCLRQNAQLQAYEVDLVFNQQHFELFELYQSSRHPKGGMGNQGKENYQQFLLQSNQDTHLWEFRDGSDLLMVSVIDRISDGISAVYTFFHPEYRSRGLGTFNILWQIYFCQKYQLDYLYLGYYVANCQKMSYKLNFKPFQLFHANIWQ